MANKQKEKEIVVTFLKEEAEELAFYLRWSDKMLFGDYEPGAKNRVLTRHARKRIRTALAVDTKQAEVTMLEKMLGPEEQAK